MIGSPKLVTRRRASDRRWWPALDAAQTAGYLARGPASAGPLYVEARTLPPGEATSFQLEGPSLDSSSGPSRRGG